MDGTLVKTVSEPEGGRLSHSLVVEGLDFATKYKFRLTATDAGGQKWVEPGTFVTKAPCNEDCVPAVTVTRSLSGGSLSFTTTESASYRLRIFQGTTLKETKEGLDFRTSRNITVSGFSMGNQVTYELSVTGESGGTHVETGSWTTLKRRVVIEIDKIKVTNDSDTAGAGEIIAFTKVDSFSSGLFERLWNWRSISDNQTVELPVSGQSPARWSNLSLLGQTTMSVMLVDDDIDIFDNCTRDQLGISWSTGSSVCWDRTTIAPTITLPFVNTNTTTVYTTTSGPVRFEVTVIVRVEIS